MISERHISTHSMTFLHTTYTNDGRIGMIEFSLTILSAPLVKYYHDKEY